MTGGVERFTNENGSLMALIIRSSYDAEGIEFFTDDSSSQQLGYMKRPAGYEVVPHHHNKVQRTVTLTQEVLFIKSGSCQLDLYDAKGKLDKSINLYSGDVVLLAEGGHGLEMLEETEIIEVKQGPFSGDSDKTRFNPEGKN